MTSGFSPPVSISSKLAVKEVPVRLLAFTSRTSGRFGRTVRTRVRGALVPERLEAVKVTLCSPVSVVTPVMIPVTGSRLNPSGKPAAA